MNERLWITCIGLIAACATGRQTVPGMRGGAVGSRDSAPPRLAPDKRFTPPYAVPLRRVGVTGNVEVSMLVEPTGAIDTSSVRVLSATNQMFAIGLRGSFVNLRVIPGRAAGRPISGNLKIQLAFRLVNCDTTGDARRTMWDADSTPPKITIWQCYRPIMAGLYPNAKKVAHATLSGLLSIAPDWESRTGFQVCRTDHARIPVPGASPSGIGVDLRGVVDWARVDAISGGRHPRDRYFVRWEGDVYGPPASEHLGADRYQFRPTRILEAARWTERSCVL